MNKYKGVEPKDNPSNKGSMVPRHPYQISPPPAPSVPTQKPVSPQPPKAPKK